MQVKTGFLYHIQQYFTPFINYHNGEQYKVALAITGAIQGTSREKIYQELGLESLRTRRWYKRLSCMFKIVKEEAPNYLINLIPKIQKIQNSKL